MTQGWMRHPRMGLEYGGDLGLVLGLRWSFSLENSAGNGKDW